MTSLGPAVALLGPSQTGKSTLAGQFLAVSSSVDSRALEKLETLAMQAGSSRCKFAWVMDRQPAARERGASVDFAVRKADTKPKAITLIDCPGRPQYLGNLVAGASQVSLFLSP